MTGAIVTINLPGEPRKNNDRMLRAVAEDTRVETIRKTVTAMMRKPQDYVIGNKRATPTWKAKPVVRGDEDVIPGVEVDATVEKALA